MDQASDGTLLAALERGDTTALTNLLDRHQAVLLRHARALLGEGGPYEDVVQEAFLRLLEKPPAMPEEARGNELLERAHLRSWLHKVTRNLCMDTLRSETRRRAREESVASHDVSRDGRSGGDLAEQLDTRAAVERELAKLPADQREVLVLRLLGERSYKEIAEITGKKIGTVGWLVSEGLKALSASLAPLVDAPAPAAAASVVRASRANG
ncbi:MAG: RNA polymerase sigma factor [Planctomycetes bacterium]|nr:RNA polymerase sigma factor [Planctomycetota bacterium]